MRGPDGPFEIVLASRNQGKLRELRTLIQDLPLDVLGMGELCPDLHVEETGRTFLENARLKALEVSRATGLPALADDSGLEVDALHGRPGVFSARYGSSDSERIQRLLDELSGLPDHLRTARFRCFVVFADASESPSKELHATEGACEGRILMKPQGSGGFGYDPVFWHPASGKTFAQMDPEEKNRMSHRSRAMRRMAAFLARWAAAARP